MPPTRPHLVIYHADCPDGFGAAYAAWLVLGDSADYLPCKHGEPAPEVSGRQVYILDFSFDPEQLAAMSERAASVTLLDHHQTAHDRLSCMGCGPKLTMLFDMKKSGARLAWEHFHPGQPLPYLIARIEDRDLWNWRFDDSRDFLAVLDTQGFDFAVWRGLSRRTEDPAALAALLEQGRALCQQFEGLVASAAKGAFELTLLGHKTLAVNAPSEFTSDLGNLLAQRTGSFAVVFRVENAGYAKISLRSLPGCDVSQIALRFGGGGHPQASAFRLPMARFPEFLAGTLA
ncbi:MAG: hypothetical protein RJA36_1792 [Pseudomonadota bacterium]|jgi:hypothetical protein